MRDIGNILAAAGLRRAPGADRDGVASRIRADAERVGPLRYGFKINGSARTDRRRMAMTNDFDDLEGLMAAARNASPSDRISWRDPIAAHSPDCIDAIAPWLQEPRFAAFAIRVIERAGSLGQPGHAVAVLRRARPRMAEAVRGDVDWALRQIRAATDPAPRPAAHGSSRPAPHPEAPRDSGRPVVRMTHPAGVTAAGQVSPGSD